jgi:hypothetical protein
MACRGTALLFFFYISGHGRETARVMLFSVFVFESVFFFLIFVKSVGIYSHSSEEFNLCEDGSLAGYGAVASRCSKRCIRM